MAVSCRVFKQLHNGGGRYTWVWTSRIWSPVKFWPMQLENRRWGRNEGRWRNWDSWRNHFPNESWSVRHIVEGRNSVGTSLHTADDPLLLQRKKSIHMLPPWVSLVLLAFGFFWDITRRDAKVYSPLKYVVWHFCYNIKLLLCPLFLYLWTQIIVLTLCSPSCMDMGITLLHMPPRSLFHVLLVENTLNTHI